MVDGAKLRRFGVDKLAFLILLIIGMGIAQFVISSRTTFELSEAIKLKGTGLEVSLPKSGNWKQITNDFTYIEREFRLASQLPISSDSGISVIWRYFLLPSNESASEKFEQYATGLQGHIVSSGTKQFGQFNFDFAKIEAGTLTTFIGTTVLPNDRVLTLEVSQKGTGVELAENVFKTLLASAKYYDENSFAKGAEFLKKFKTTFMPSLADDDLTGQIISDYFRIKDASGNSIGFTTDSLNYTAEPNDNYNLTLSSLFFFSPSSKTLAEQSCFRSDMNLTIFEWLVKEGDLQANRQQTIRLVLDSNSIITIEKSGRIQQLLFTNIMIPECLFDMIVAEFLKSDYDTIYVEAILSDGRLAPVLLSRIKSSETAALPERSAAQADFFGEFVATHKCYYDGSGHLVSSDIQSGISYRRERTTRASIFADFPQWLTKIQKMEQSQNVKKKSK
ncbi:MAG: hypothetical protein LLF92_00230 [Planctomycetaceae bacterium]|nr:hypothetical protein [Planctomycetaceae bacterium]